MREAFCSVDLQNLDCKNAAEKLAASKFKIPFADIKSCWFIILGIIPNMSFI